MKSGRTYGGWMAIAICIMCAGCFNKHVNGSTLPPEQVCTRNWTAIVTNNTDRIYDLYIGTRFVGTAEARATSRTVIQPEFGMATPSLREASVTRDLKGPRITQGAIRMVCE